MKLKRYHLLLLASLCFFIVFIGINKKYDRFYRIQGMNNDNRILIETYLDEEQQNYIIQNNIPVDAFIDYIKLDDFLIYNYEYYHKVREKEIFLSLQDVVVHTNKVVDKLSVETPWTIMDSFIQLLENDLLIDYELNEEFKFNYIDIYSALKPYYALEESNYIHVIDSLMDSLLKLGYESVNERRDLLEKLFVNYSPSQVLDLIDYASVNKKINFLLDPTDTMAVVNKDNYISNYVPTNLVVINDISRLSYFTYLNKAAYEDLKAMFEAYNNAAFDESIMVVQGYQSYESLSNENAGFSESQLGLTVSFKVEGISISDFDNTNFKQWLNQHAYEYGFILRYPSKKEEVTLHEYVNNLYRYVGKEAALKMHQDNIETLEEYLRS